MDGLPRYRVVRESLREDIRTQFKLGEKLPPEPELMKRFGVSRITIRHALEQLRTEGLITRVQGKGTFVAYPAVQPELGVVRSFTDDIRASGQTPSTKVLEVKSVPGPSRACELLDLPPKTTLVLIEKVRLADETPISFEVSYLREELAVGWSPKLIEHRPIFSIITELHGIALVRSNSEVTAGAASRRVAKWLRTKVGSPLLQVERVTYDRENSPIDYDILYYRPDRVRYTLRTNRRSKPGGAEQSHPGFFIDGVARLVTQ